MTFGTTAEKRLVATHETVFIPRGTSYAARVTSDNGSRVLRVELPGGNRRRPAEYEGRIWRGPVHEDGTPALDEG
jgi:hypothetical protein